MALGLIGMSIVAVVAVIFYPQGSNAGATSDQALISASVIPNTDGNPTEIPVEIIKEVPVVVEKEVIKEIPVEVIVEREVPVEVVVVKEVVREVPVEKIVTQEVVVV